MEVDTQGNYDLHGVLETIQIKLDFELFSLDDLNHENCQKLKV